VFREKFPKSSFKQRIFKVRGAEPEFLFKLLYACDSDMFCTMNSCYKG